MRPYTRTSSLIDFPNDNPSSKKKNSIWNLAYLIAGLGFHSKIALTFLDCMSEIYGISVMLINVRVGLGWTRNGERAAVSLPGTNKRREGTRRGNHVILVHPVGKS